MLKVTRQTHRIVGSRRLLIALCAAAAFPSIATAADYYITPTGAGSSSGADWANADAFSESTINTIVDDLNPGDTLYFGSGTYQTGAGPIITITSSGTAGSPQSIIGVDTGGGLPVFQGTFDVNGSASASDIFLKFSGSTAYWVIQDLVLEEYAFPVRMNLSGTTYTLRHDITFDNIDGQNVNDFFQLRNASDIIVKNCDVVRYRKKGFRYADYTAFIAFENCSADANGGDDSFPTQSIPAGFVGGDTNYAPIIHDISFTDCVARNNRFVQSPGTYWNGDGFSTEEGTYNITYTRCHAFNNHDGGFDDKADNITYVGSVAIGNAKGFRYWGNNGTYINCLSAYNRNYGGNNASDGLWVGRQSQGNIGVAHVYLSTFHNNDEWALEAYDGGEINVYDSILSVDGVFTDGELEKPGGNITLSNVAKFKASDNLLPDPGYLAPSASWTGTPANAFDSTVYSPGQGYYSQYSPGSGTIVTVSVSDGTAGEPGDDGAFTLTASPTPASPFTVNLGTSGTATPGSDYVALPSTIIIDTTGTAVVDLPVIDDTQVEGNETVTLTIDPGIGYDVGIPDSATITLTDDDSALPTVSITAIDDDAAEPYYDGKYRLTATPAPSGQIDINITMSGTATNGTDYKTIANYGHVTMGSSGTVDVLLDVLDDNNDEGDETAIMTATAGSGYLVGPQDSATIVIEDNDLTPVIEVSVIDSSAAEPYYDGKFRLTATPAPTSQTKIYLTMSGTATNGTDYKTIANYGYVTMNSSGTLDILLDVTNDSLVEGDETAILTIDPHSGYAVGSASSDSITIVDND